MPILTKFCGKEQSELMARLKATLVEHLILHPDFQTETSKGKPNKSLLIDLTTLMYYYECAGLDQNDTLKQLFLDLA